MILVNDSLDISPVNNSDSLVRRAKLLNQDFLQQNRSTLTIYPSDDTLFGVNLSAMSV